MPKTTEMQRPVAVMEFWLNRVFAELMKVEQGREAFTDRRWRADFDLSLARVRAARLRLRVYSHRLAEMKANVRALEEGKRAWELAAVRIEDNGPLEAAEQGRKPSCSESSTNTPAHPRPQRPRLSWTHPSASNSGRRSRVRHEFTPNSF
ncbi:MAG: hypothetical protein DWQ34_22955 [Planctomycetota bacterium]|nr:MAG: hypothetical protein DWQ29_15245 [Planctomycetota bacterium]REJ88191.1 MAG: hypothetical protein DWQ34_22955 [Planctomycetota bacterium]REK24510.1 MAG: hypothetical protein DWQ41_15990 [Planctomycetota bacterium]REK32471.1 MAG: hypothetical protein DWQ45_17125 [Planctomycetota bacterium]